MGQQQLEIGIVGAGIGGLLCSIAIARAGAKVTIIEAAQQLGEIGAGIQMTPNVSRFLIRYGVDKVIGKNLVSFPNVNLRRKDGTPVGYAKTARVETITGFPWWVVHRHHLHTGLAEIARKSGVDIVIDSRVTALDQLESGRVLVSTQKGKSFKFDLVIGSDGVQSVVRKQLFPHVRAKPPTGNCAYRAVVPYDEVLKDPLTRELVVNKDGSLSRTMDIWMAPTGYIISYPISDAKEFNMVLSHFRDPPIDTVQPVDLEEVRHHVKEYDPRIRRVVEKIPPGVSRWPLLVTGPLPSWSNPAKNIVLLGDAAHSMTNHMAQGAATAMEDGAFLARCLRLVVEGKAKVADAVKIYEEGRMPKASFKQQLSFMNGWLWHLPDGPASEARDKAMESELKDEVPKKSPNVYTDPGVVRDVYCYDAEAHADAEIAAWLKGRVARDETSTVEESLANDIANWFLPEEHKFKIRPHL